MSFFAILLEALHSLLANKLRSSLTMLGMIIGVASVIVMIAIGQGSQSAIKRTIASLGSNLLIVSTGGSVMQNNKLRPQTLTPKDLEALQRLPLLTIVAPVIKQPIVLSYRGVLFNSYGVGTTRSYFDLREWPLRSGVFFTDLDNTNEQRVVVLGGNTAKQMFDNQNPLNQIIRINHIDYAVIGVLKEKGQGLDGEDQDDVVIIPEHTMRKRLLKPQDANGFQRIYARVHNDLPMEIARKYVQKMLKTNHNMGDNRSDGFKIRDVQAIAETALKTSRIMTLLLGSIASISLIVGGIGIMNIMLVCVTERTREIGIRKSIGASQRIIMLQFLYESVLIAIIGCVIGIGIGISITWVANAKFEVETQLNGWPILIAFSVATITGLFFGLYPARKASRLLPLEALRFQ